MLALLVAQHDVTAVAARRREEGELLAVDRLDMRAAAVARPYFGLGQTFGDGDRRCVDDGARRLDKGDLALLPACGDLFDLVDEGEVGVGRRRGMVGLEDAEERPRRRRPRREGHGSRLKRRAAGLVLQALRGEVHAEAKRNSIGVAAGGTHQLAEVGGESGGALETAVRGPGMRAALREILSAHHDRIGARMARDEVIEILARVGFVAHQETGIAEAEVLNEQSVAGQLGFASVLDR